MRILFWVHLNGKRWKKGWNTISWRRLGVCYQILVWKALFCISYKDNLLHHELISFYILGWWHHWRSLYWRKVNYSHIKIFLCESFAHIPKDKRTKLNYKYMKWIFQGYVDVKLGYQLWDPVKNKIIRRRDFIFNEL